MGIKNKHLVLIFVLGLILCSLFATTLHIKKNKSVSNKPVGNETIDDTSKTTIIGETTEESLAKATADNSIDSTFLNEETIGAPVNTTAPAETSKAPETAEDPHSHHYYKRVVKATCTSEGYTLNVCDCGDKYTTESTTKLGHSYTTWYVAQEATTTETGIKECRCARCGGEPITEVIPKKTAESSFDSRISVRKILGQTVYDYGACHVINRRTWGNVLSISILDNGGLHVTYDNKNGEVVEFDVLPVDGYESNGILKDDGSYTTSIVGAFS